MYTYRKFIAARFSDAYSLTRVAKKNKTYLLRTSSLKDDNVKKALRSFSADVIVSVASTRIFDKEILSIPRLACINVHAGKLPKYRGVNPSFWALLNGEKESAITVHYMNESIDDGEIIQQDIFNISGITSLHKVYMKLLEIAPRTLVTSLIAIDKGTVKTKKNPSSSSYFSYPKKEDGRRFRSLGLKFI
jgi:methionyl-tRNA formyltransferase